MSIRSMTGCARAVFSVGDADWTLEISAVNQRGLAVFVSAPPEWMPDAEHLLAALAREHASRGKINILVRAGTPGGGNSGAEIFAWDEAAAAAALARLAAAAERAGAAFAPTPEVLLRLAELHRTHRAAVPAFADESVSAALADAARRAFSDFVEMREREGANLEKDLRERLARLRAWTAKIREASAGTVPAARDALRARLAVLGTEIDLDDPRVLKEIALFADRADISEELTRLDSHFAQFEETLGELAGGRKLDFICQEILREFNTIGSKANNAAVTRCVVEAKNEQERLREQVQNVE